MHQLSVPQDDGLIIPTVGQWSKDKHYFLYRYIDAFTTSMKGKKWEGLHYIDLFAGAGIERLEDSRTLEWGSPMIAAKAPYPFTRLHLCEQDKEKYEALQTRITSIRTDSQILCGDANEKIKEILDPIPVKALSLVFLDPFGLHLEYSTIKQLSGRRADLIIFFPDRLDVLRNWASYYFDNPDSNLDRYLGEDSNWRDIVDKVSSDKLAEEFKKLYIRQLRKIGFEHFAEQRISLTKGQPLYLLIFCSKHELGVRFWNNVSLKQPNGQRLFDF